MLERIRRKLIERRLLKDYIISNKVARLLGDLVGARPYFITFEEFRRQQIRLVKYNYREEK